jgi:hypothetical protein
MPEDKDRALIPIEERTVEFYGDEIKGVRVTRTPSGRSEFFVPLRPLCDYLGISYTGQRERIERDPVLSSKLQSVVMETAGGAQEMQCLALDYLNGWLFGINANRINPKNRERVIRYQEECYLVLRDAFQGSRASDPLAQVEQLGQALITLAREQREFNKRMDETEERVDAMDRRLVAVESRVSPGEPVTEEQAQQISQAVKAIAYKLSERSGRNEYGGVYSQLYGKFGITSYKLLPSSRYEEAMAFLGEWWQQVAGTGDVPF